MRSRKRGGVPSKSAARKWSTDASSLRNQSTDPVKIRPNTLGVGSIFQPPAKLPQRLAQAGGVKAASLVTVKRCMDRSKLRLHRPAEIGHCRKKRGDCALRVPARGSPKRFPRTRHTPAAPSLTRGSYWISEAKAVKANLPARAIT